MFSTDAYHFFVETHAYSVTYYPNYWFFWCFNWGASMTTLKGSSRYVDLGPTA